MDSGFHRSDDLLLLYQQLDFLTIMKYKFEKVLINIYPIFLNFIILTRCFAIEWFAPFAVRNTQWSENHFAAVFRLRPLGWAK